MSPNINSNHTELSNQPEHPKEPSPSLSSRRSVFRWELVSEAISSLTHNWTRSALTLTGIVIGMVAIVTLIAILQGVKVEIRKQVEGLGANLVLIVPGKLDENGQPNPGAITGLSTLKEADLDALKNVPGVDRISPVYIVSGSLENEAHKSVSAFVVGTDKVGVQMNPTPLREGRYFEDNEENVCILGSKPRLELFGNQPAIGRKVVIQGYTWKVVGVLGKPDSSASLGSTLLALNTLVYLPAPTVKKLLPGSQVNRIVLQTDYQHPANRIVEQLNQCLLNSHKGQEDFGVITQEKGLAIVIRFLNMAQLLLVLIAAISLVVAGVGIMNIMLVTVTERTREIGVRKTVGARQSDIFCQFLTEAIVLSLLGGAIGILASWIVCLIIAKNSLLTPIITPELIAMALAVCTSVGVLFGVTPAMRASRLDPIVAIRHE